MAQGVATLEEKISCCWPDVKGRVEEAGVEQSQERQTDRQSPGLGVGADPLPLLAEHGRLQVFIIPSLYPHPSPTLEGAP